MYIQFCRLYPVFRFKRQTAIFTVFSDSKIVFVILYSDNMTVNPAERKTKLSKHLMQMKVIVCGSFTVGMGTHLL